MLFHTSTVRNALLASLDSDAFEILRPHLQRVSLKRGQVLQEARRKPSKIYFIDFAALVGSSKS